jgi:DNA modification methylase
MVGDISMKNITEQYVGDEFAVYNADSVQVLKEMPPSSVHLSLMSPPYLALYTYSASDHDIGNSSSDAEFWNHFQFVVDELVRVTKPGRIVAIDCMNVPAMKERDGYIGIKDFRGDLIRAFVKAGMIFHSEHCMMKDPLLEATRTKALGLMHKQLCKDSTMSRAGLPQYLLAFRKPGVNAEPVAHIDGLTEFYGDNPPMNGTLSHERWRRYAAPIWLDIRWTRTLNERAAREEADERHIAAMALDVVDRAVQLWSNPGDVVFDPFTGIGSTGYEAVKAGRRFLGSELKSSYYQQALVNIKGAIVDRDEVGLFAEMPA